MDSEPVHAVLVDDTSPDKASRLAKDGEEVSVRRARRTVVICLSCCGALVSLHAASSFGRFQIHGESWSVICKWLFVVSLAQTLPLFCHALIALLCRRRRDMSEVLLVGAVGAAVRTFLLALAVILSFITSFPFPPAEGALGHQGVLSYLEAISLLILLVDTFLIAPLYWLCLALALCVGVFAVIVAKIRRRHTG